MLYRRIIGGTCTYICIVAFYDKLFDTNIPFPFIAI